MKFQKAYEKVMMAWTMEEAGEYRALARALHPDLNGDEPRAGEAMAKLQVLNSSVDTALSEWDFSRKIDAGDIADVYLVTRGTDRFVLKKGEAEFLQTEAERLTAFKDHSQFPVFVASTEGNLIEYVPRDGLVPLEYLNGDVDFRHVVWMGRRLLATLAFAHNKGFLHGAVLPRHTLFLKKDHEVRLVDWCYSVKVGEKLKAMVTSQERFYPPEATKRKKLGPDFDVYMAAKTLQVVTPHVPKEFRPWFEKATLGQPRNRWRDAWEAYDSLTSIAASVYGPPRFVVWPD